MNRANFYASKRLQRLGKVLLGGGWLSTRDLVSMARVVAVSAGISELRAQAQPWAIECRQRVTSKGRVFEYKAIFVPPEARKMLCR